MSERIHRHVRMNLVAYLALFVALSGSAYAAGGIAGPGDSLTRQQTGERPAKKVKPRCKKGVTVLRGSLCAGSDGALRVWTQAMNYCTGLGLELPTLSQARAMAKKHNVPGVPEGGAFWTNDSWEVGSDDFAYAAFEEGGWISAGPSSAAYTVCTRAPTYR
jgi:hypothetical protein